jgi:hypothetical protein
MPQDELYIPYPLRGQSDNFAFGSQEDDTTRDELNVRSIDPLTGRSRGAQRAGLDTFANDAQHGSAKIADIAAVASPDGNLTWAKTDHSSSHDEVWSVDPPSKQAVGDLKIDQFGDLYIASDATSPGGTRGVFKYNADGALLQEILIPETASVTPPAVSSFAVDQFRNVFIALGQSSGQTKISEAAIYLFQHQLDGTYTHRWTHTGHSGFIDDIVAIDNGSGTTVDLYTLENNGDVSAPPSGEIIVAEGVLGTASAQGTTTSKDKKAVRLTDTGASFHHLSRIKPGDQVMNTQETGDPVGEVTSVGSKFLDHDALDAYWWESGSTYCVHSRTAIHHVGQTFLTKGVGVGDLVENVSDGSKAVVTEVRTEERLVTTPLEGGKHNLYIGGPDGSTGPDDGDARHRYRIRASRQAFLRVYRGVTVEKAPKIYDLEVPLTTSGSDRSPIWARRMSVRDDGVVYIAGSSDDNGTATLETGSATSGDATGITLTDTAATFLANGVSVADLVTNTTTSATARVSAVISDTVLRTEALSGGGGSDNEYGVSDNYTITGMVDCALWKVNPDAEDPNRKVWEVDGRKAVVDQKTIGECDAGGSSTLLIDGTANMETLGISLGDTATNITDGSTAEVVLVGPGTDRVTTTALTGGSANTWANNDDYKITSNVGGLGLGGIGYGVAVGPVIETPGDANAGKYTLYTCGPLGSSGETAKHVRRIIDTGLAVDATTSPAWSFDATDDFLSTPEEVKRLRLAVDEDDTLYVPFRGATKKAVLILEADGTQGNSFIDTDSAGVVTSVAVPLDKPDYGGVDIPESEFVYYAGNRSSVTKEAFWGSRLATVVQSSNSPRDMKLVAVAGGTIKTGFAEGVGFTTPSGGAGALDSAAPYVQSVTAFQKVYFTDGKQYRVYDPSPPEDAAETVELWKSSTDGHIPPRCRLIELWRGRMVLGRDPEDPHLWHMSAISEPNNWDTFPALTSAKQAVTATLSRAGGVPDIVNSICPVSDDICAFGGDHGIYVLRGDPMSGGQMDLVTSATGMAFGRPWTKDPSGALWFIGSRGSLYRWAPSGLPERVSRDLIERRLQEVDFGTHYVRLVWNYEDEGLHIFYLPYDSVSVKTHYFFDGKSGAFHQDRFLDNGAATYQPTSAVMVDGDAQDDRVILLGCNDSRIRRWDRDEPQDSASGSAAGAINIDSYVVIGPIAPDTMKSETQFSEYTAWLASDQGGCNYEFFVDDEPDVLGTAVASGSLRAGHNGAKLARFTGDVAYLRLRNAGPTRWAYEKSKLLIAPAGVKRVRL